MKDMNDPTNVDTVPAMLTPGEFVLNKEASQMYAPIIEQMNQHGLQQRHAENQMVQKYNTGGLVDFLKEHEGWSDKAYQDSAGVWTIGYGRTFNADGSPVREGQKTTKDAENSWIQDRAQKDYGAVKEWAEQSGEDYSPQELEALASFRYNLGPGGFNQLTADGTRTKAEIQAKLPLYVNAGGRKIDGLVNRRNFEMEHAGWGQQPQQEVAPPPPETAPPPSPEVPQPPPEQQEVVDVSPRAEAGDQMLLGDMLGGAIPSLFGGGSGPVAPMPQMQGGQQAKSAAEIRAMTQGPAQPKPIYDVGYKQNPDGTWTFNMGGSVPVYQHLNKGGWLANLLGWGGSAEDKQQVANALKRRPGFRSADPLAGTFVNPMDQPPEPSFAGFGRDSVPEMPATPDSLTRPGMAEHVANRFNFESPSAEYTTDNIYSAPPVSADTEGQSGIMGWRGLDGEGPTLGDKWDMVSRPFIPEFDTAPPVPGSDEALLQGASDNVERLEAEYRPTTTGATARDPSQIENFTEGVPQVAPPPQVPGDTTAPTDSGWTSLTPEQFLQEAQPKNVDQADGHNAPPPEVQQEVEQIAETSAASEAHNIPIPEKRAAVEERLNVNNETATPEETSAAETAGAQAPPERIEKAKGILQENFGGLFDQKELARAAVLFAGAMLTGASPQKALAIAGQQYLGRLDAKEAMRVKTEADRQKALAKGAPQIDMTQSEDFVVDGKKVTGYKMTKILPDGSKVTDYVGKDGVPLPTNRHQNFDQTPGTSEYNKRVQSESKQYGQIISEALDAYDPEVDGFRKSGILPKASGPKVAKWAIANGIPPEAMGQLIENATQSAVNESRNGQKAKSIEAYLNEQYIESQVGDPSLFQDVDADKVTSLMQTVASRSGMQGSIAQVSTPIIQAALPIWDQLPAGERERYIRKAKGTGKSPFMIFIEEDINS